MEEVIIYGTMFFIIGTVFGSFFNVVGYRLPNNMSIIYPPSHCPNCNHKLTVLELIPILSYIFQRGKCKHCGKKIEVFYPIFETITGLLFLLSYLIFNFDPMLYIALVFVSSLLIVILSDIKYMIIPDEILICSAVILIVLRVIFNGFNDMFLILLDGILPFLFMLFIKITGDIIFKKESLGGGDVKLMIIFGLVLGFKMSIFSIFLASFIAFPISLFGLLKHRKHILPFGPYLSIAALLILFLKIDFESLIKFIVLGSL